MKYSLLRRRAIDNDLSRGCLLLFLETKFECEWLDYKECFDISSQKGLANFAKDALALRNSGGGYIIVGVRDKTWEPVGLSEQLSYDSKLLIDKVRKATKLELSITIAHHKLRFDDDWRCFAFINVRGPSNINKLKAPLRPLKGFCPQEAWGIHQGTVYFRIDDSTRAVSDDEILNVVANLEEKLGDDFEPAKESPFAIDDGFYRLLDKGFESFVGRQELRKKLTAAVEHDPRIWIVNVHGSGGIGKSALVNWFTYENYRNKSYEAILQLTAKTQQLTTGGIERTTPSLYSLEGLVDNILALFGENAESLERRKELAYEALYAFRFLLVLDNMETIADARILEFIQGIPPGSKTKVLLTSRKKTGGWEYPVYVPELNSDEIQEFINVKAMELRISFPTADPILDQVKQATGGLPLAILWLLGRYKIERDVNVLFRTLRSKDSPVLEFTFRNIWMSLPLDSKALLGALSIFDDLPTIEMLAIATDWPIERIDNAIGSLEEVTLIDKVMQKPSGRMVYTALPLTLDFAAKELTKMGDFAAECSKRYNEFTSNTDFGHSPELNAIFRRYDITSTIEKKAVRLCKRIESEVFAGNTEIAESLFEQARALAPTSAYVLCMFATFDLQRNHLQDAETTVNDACSTSTNHKLKAYCYATKARVLEAKKDKNGVVAALQKALELDNEDLSIRHRYGVALSKVLMYKEAIEQFTTLIDSEIKRKYPQETLMMALVTRAVNWLKLDNSEEAKKDITLAKELLKTHRYLQSSEPWITRLELQIERHNTG